jgi:hypothetical protein
MGVTVSAIDALVDSGNGYPYGIWSDASQNVTLSAADGSNPRIDRIIAYVDLSVVSSVSSNNPNAWNFLKVNGTPAGSPSAPNTAAIQAAILAAAGSSAYPYIILGQVLVGAGVTTISTANVTDERVMVHSTASNTLGYAEIASDFTTTTSGSFVNVTGLSIPVTVPAGGRRIKITAHAPALVTSGTSGQGLRMGIFDVDTGATLGLCDDTTAGSNYKNAATAIACPVPTAGVHNYKVMIKQDTANTLRLQAASDSPAFILVELI